MHGSEKGVCNGRVMYGDSWLNSSESQEDHDSYLIVHRVKKTVIVG